MSYVILSTALSNSELVWVVAALLIKNGLIWINDGQFVLRTRYE